MIRAPWPAYVLIASLVVAGIGYFTRPHVATVIWGDEYKQLMYECDHAMREHLIAKSAVELSPSSMTVKNLQSSEVGLLRCHDYDKLRKHLLAWGLSNNDLALLGLDAMEEKAYDLQHFVEIHEIRY